MDNAMNKSLIYIIVLMLATAFQLDARNRFMVQAGGNVSHYCESPIMLSLIRPTVGAGVALSGQAMRSTSIGTGASHRRSNWLISTTVPGCRPKDSPFNRNAQWLDMWTVNVPVLAGFRFNLEKNVGLKISTGPYVLKAFSIRQTAQDGISKETPPQRRATATIQFRLDGRDRSRARPPFLLPVQDAISLLVESWTKKTLTLSLGVRYDF